MDLTTLANRTDLVTLITERGTGFLRAQYRHHLKGENALLVKMKGKRHVLDAEKMLALKGIPKVSAIPEEMNLHQEMNLERQTGEKCEGIGMSEGQ